MQNSCIRAVCVLLVIIIGISGTIGCLSQTKTGTDANNTTNYPTTTTYTPIETRTILPTQTVQSQCPPPGITGPYIIINPIGDHYRGDVFEINGTTDLGVDEKLHYSVAKNAYFIPVSISGPPGATGGAMRLIEGSDNVTSGDINIVKDECNGQKWSFLLSTSGPGFDGPVEFYLNITSKNLTIRNSTHLFDLGKLSSPR